MSRTLSARLLALALAGTMLAPLPVLAKHASSHADAGDSNDPVVARVNGDAIHRSDVMEVLKQGLPAGTKPTDADLEKFYPRIINELISHKLAYQQAVKEGVASRPEVKREIAMASENVVDNAYFHKLGDPAVTDESLHKAYDEAVARQGSQEEVHARHITVKTEDEAKDIIKQLDGGADFEKLAKDKSLDKNNAKDGGDLGFFVKGTMDPGVADAAFALTPGSYTKTPVKSVLGYEVVQSVEKRPVKLPGFEEAKAQLSGEIAKRAIGQKLQEIAKSSDIKLFNVDGSPLKPPPAEASGASAGALAGQSAPSGQSTPASGAGAPLQLPQTAPTP